MAKFPIVIQYRIRFDDEPPESAAQMRIIVFDNTLRTTTNDKLPNIVIQRRVISDSTSEVSWDECGDRIPPGVICRMAINALLSYTLPGTNRYEGLNKDSAAEIRMAEDAREKVRPPRWALPNAPGLGAPDILIVDLGEFLESHAMSGRLSAPPDPPENL